MAPAELRQLIERLHHLWSTGDLAAIPSVYAADFVGHMSASSGLGTIRGHGEIRELIERLRHAVPTFTETVQDIVIDGDKVVTRYVCTGKQTRPFLDRPPSNEPIRVTEISIFHVRGRLVAEQWCGSVVSD